MVKHYPSNFNNGIDMPIESGFSCLWVYILGPLVGGGLAGIWKQYDANVRYSVGDIDHNHPRALNWKLNRNRKVPSKSKKCKEKTDH